MEPKSGQMLNPDIISTFRRGCSSIGRLAAPAAPTARRLVPCAAFLARGALDGAAVYVQERAQSDEERPQHDAHGNANLPVLVVGRIVGELTAHPRMERRSNIHRATLGPVGRVHVRYHSRARGPRACGDVEAPTLRRWDIHPPASQERAVYALV
ncbi:hypothetical protein HJFPF1_07032 [Paramyrothecium foliicola]|nr:hypothetical protein HJFPF1_07032 [Paramyrothecium foliicola]